MRFWGLRNRLRLSPIHVLFTRTLSLVLLANSVVAALCYLYDFFLISPSDLGISSFCSLLLLLLLFMLLLVLSLLLLFYWNLSITFDYVAAAIIILTEPITSVVIVLSFYRNLSITFVNVIVIIIILPKSFRYLTHNHIHRVSKESLLYYHSTKIFQLFNPEPHTWNSHYYCIILAKSSSCLTHNHIHKVSKKSLLYYHSTKIFAI